MDFKENDLKLKTLKNYWGFNEFRKSQEEIIDNVLQKKDILALLPTGGGKSLCYQLPAIILKGTCLVISPLVALMEDQVNQLEKKGIEATYLNSSHSFREIDRILDNVIYGSIKILYISPERIKSKLFEARFKKMNISFIAVDEAHCISEWGNDFRPDFRTISKLREWKSNLTFIALTASATKSVIIDIQDQLLFKNKNVIRKSYLRKNINYKIIDAIHKETVLLKIIKKECSIIYTKTRKKAEQISKLLNKNKFRSEFYHGGLNFEERITKQKKWIDNEVEIMVATNAFGMGIDKSDVRTVIHFEISNTIESFYQESGRAGRDGKTSYSVILKSDDDFNRLNNRFINNYPDLEKIKNVFQCISNIHQIGIGYNSEQNYELDLDEIAQKVKLTRAVTYSCIKYLIKEEYIKELNEYQYSKIKIISPIQSLNRFLKSYMKFENIIEILIRSYSNITDRMVAISENIISKRLNIEVVKTIHLLEQLQQQNIIKYDKKKSNNMIQFSSPRPNIDKLNLSKKYIELKKIASEKNQAVIEFINSKTECRNLYMLNYFGEIITKKCNYCDNCYMGLNKKNNPNNVIENAILILLNYEPKSPNYLYIQFKRLIKKDVFNSILKNMIKRELVLVNNRNLIFVNS